MSFKSCRSKYCGEALEARRCEGSQAAAVPQSRRPFSSLALARTLGVAADNLDLVRHDNLAAIVELEVDVLDQEGPHLIAETVGIERALYAQRRVLLISSCSCLSRTVSWCCAC